jgi:hypothetical protein
LIFVLSGGKPAGGGTPGPIGGGPQPGLGNPGQQNPQPGEVEAARRPQFPPVPDLVLFPGDERLVEVKVARRGYEGPIELRLRRTEVGASGAPGGPLPGGGLPPGLGKFPPMRGPEAPRARPGDVRVPETVTIPAASETAQFRLTVQGEAGAGVHAFELTAAVEPAPGQPLVPVQEDGAGMVMPTMVRRFLVTVRKAPRGTPTVLPVAASSRPGDREMQIEVVRGQALILDYQPATRELTMVSSPGSGLVPAEVARPAQLVVVQASFPYKAQLEAFRKALRLRSEAELFDRPEMAPRFLGLNVLRREVRPGGEKSPWEPLYRIDPESGQLSLAPVLGAFFRQATRDEDQNAAVADYLVRGLACPLPRLTGATYRPVDLVGIDAKPVFPSPKAPGMTGQPKPGGPKFQPGPGKEVGPKDVNTQVRDLLQLLLKLQQNDPKRKARLVELTQLFKETIGDKRRQLQALQEYYQKHYGAMKTNPKGGNPAKAGPGAEPSGNRQRMHLSQLPQRLRDRLQGRTFALDPYGRAPPGALPGAPPGPDFVERPERCLVRFLDVGVSPGKTYQYSIQVCMANPNFGQRAEVRTDEEARKPCLLSAPVLTEEVRAGPDWHFYVVDQSPLETKVAGFKTVDRLRPVPPDRIAVQVHRWVSDLGEAGPAPPQLVGDWLIAERLLIKRGELIGKGVVEVEAPVWDATRSTHVLGRLVRPGKGKGTPAVSKTAIPINFAGDSSPVLADFWGTPEDEGYVEALALSADGRLTVRNSCDDSGRTHADGEERQVRYETWRSRLREARRQSPPPRPAGNPKDPFGP